MSLEEYEQQLAEKKALLNKKSEAKSIDMSEFKGLKVVERKDEDEGLLEVGSKKEKKGPKAKERKEVRQAAWHDATAGRQQQQPVISVVITKPARCCSAG